MLPEYSTDIDAVAGAGASRYYLEISFDPASFEQDSGLRLQGVERVRYTNTESVPLDEITFRLYPNLPGYGGEMQIDTVIVEDSLISPTLAADDSALQVPLTSPLNPGDSVDISLTYRATVPTQTQQGYNIFSYSDRTAALAGFYPAIAVFDEQGWNVDIPPAFGDATYLDTALFQVQITVPQAQVVAASGSLIDENVDGNIKTLTYASGPMRDFFIVMRDDFEVVSQPVGDVQVNSYYPPELEPGGRETLQYAVDALRVFSEVFGPYPYAEFDVVATPTTAGGIEYPGIVVIADRLYDQNGDFFEHVVVHEVAHQWWYGLVGNDQINEPWLDEALTNYSTIFYWEQIRGADIARNVMNGLFLGPYERARAQGRDQAVIGPVAGFTQADYSTFVYGKGPLFFDALRQETGDVLYLTIMRRYFEQNKYGIADTERLLDVIEQVSGKSVTPLVETWLESE